MQISKGKQSVIITAKGEKLGHFVSSLGEALAGDYGDDNCVIDLSTYTTLNLDGLLKFLSLSNTHRQAGKSCVLVNATVNYDTVPDELLVVPTLQEAEDIIEMEEIERDLGF